MEKKHAIIIIKNKNDKYLQVFQDSWNSYLFLNCKVKDENDVENIFKCVTESLDTKPISIQYKFDKIHTKFSEKDKIYKKYHHYFFLVEIITDNLPSEFDKNKKHFKWFSYKELLDDKKIQEVNSDIVNFVKDI